MNSSKEEITKMNYTTYTVEHIISIIFLMYMRFVLRRIIYKDKEKVAKEHNNIYCWEKNWFFLLFQHKQIRNIFIEVLNHK